ncbi:MAG TPA: hypothetical protein VF484_03585, partial [Candidatus Limnocylindrales bacterium]
MSRFGRVRARLARLRGAAPLARPSIPPDPPRPIAGTSPDPDLLAIRQALVPHRRRLWLRRIVRRGWWVAAAVLAAELVLWTAARFVPLELAPAAGLAIVVLGAVAWLVLAARSRPSLGEAALAVDREAGAGDRVASALALAAAPAPEPADVEALEFIRRQRADALRTLRVVRPDLFRPRLARRPAAAAAIAVLALAPVLLLPNPQDAVIAQDRQVREAAVAQAAKIDQVADQLAKKGTNPNDP